MGTGEEIKEIIKDCFLIDSEKQLYDFDFQEDKIYYIKFSASSFGSGRHVYPIKKDS